MNEDDVSGNTQDSQRHKDADKKGNGSTFEILNLKKEVLRGIEHAGFSSPSPIQEKAIPHILEGRDLIAQAQTGTGKTAAFALPILNLLNFDKCIEALIVTPTRELAMQISDEVFELGRFLRARTICIYGGQAIRRQIDLLEKKPNVMIATPGRLLDHLKNGRLKGFSPRIVVLDESDEMLDMGFIDDIEEIFKYLPNDCQTLLFSATMPIEIRNLAQKILCEPVHVKITTSNITNVDVSQRYYIINESERNQALLRLIDTESPGKSIVFIRTKREADEINNFLRANGYKSTALHGDMDQRSRCNAIESFKNNVNDILVATDVAARGLNVSDITHVFNYHMPMNMKSYVHRIGRTGRAGKKGIALTLATPLEYKELKKIRQETNSAIELYEIPSLGDDKLIDQILRNKVQDKAIDLYDRLKDKIDSAQLVLKLLSMYLDKNSKIGFSKGSFDLRDENKSDPSVQRKHGVGRYGQSHKGAKREHGRYSSERRHGFRGDEQDTARSDRGNPAYRDFDGRFKKGTRK